MGRGGRGIVLVGGRLSRIDRMLKLLELLVGPLFPTKCVKTRDNEVRVGEGGK